MGLQVFAWLTEVMAQVHYEERGMIPLLKVTGLKSGTSISKEVGGEEAQRAEP